MKPRNAIHGYRLQASLAAKGVLLVFSLSVGTELVSGGAVEAGFLAHEFELTLESGRRLEAAGPFFSKQEEGERHEWALSPLMSYYVDEGIDARRFDFLYPILTYRRVGEEYRWQFFQIFNTTGSQNQEETYPKRFSIYPIYLRQSSQDTNLNYTSVFPIYGKVKNRLRRDEVEFVLFPAYLKSRKSDVETWNYLFPIFHLREGDNLSGWQLWPIWGQERKGVTQRTNTLDEVEVVGGHHRWFAAWPLVFHQHSGIGTTQEVKFQAVLPFISRQRSAGRDSTTYLWPLFTVTDDRDKGYREWDAPWPFVVFARGKGKQANRVWPLFSRASNTNLQSGFVLWPLYKYNGFRTASMERDRHRVAFFLFSHKNERQLETGATRQRTDLWPLYSASRGYDGSRRWQFLSVLDPIWPDNPSIRRNYSPLWSLWRYEENPKTGRASHSVLWNLFRWERGPEMKKGAFLFGLFQRESTPRGNRWRIFYLPTRSGDAVPAIETKP
jgi:hypothetical protein